MDGRTYGNSPLSFRTSALWGRCSKTTAASSRSSARFQVKIHSIIRFFVVCHSLRLTFTKTNSYEIMSRALFEKYEKKIIFTLVLNEEFLNSSRPIFWWQICNPDVISFHLIGRTICFYEEIRISISKPPLSFWVLFSNSVMSFVLLTF